MGRGAIAAVVVAAMAAGAGPAQASTVSAPFGANATFQAAPGERNAVSYRLAGEGLIEIADAGAVLSAGPGCDDDGSGSIRCQTRYLVVNAGDGDDTVTRTGDAPDHRFEEVYGEEGDDTISATDEIGFADGGPGDDVLSAPGGAGRLIGGEGNDRLQGGPHNDVLMGGDGDDAIDGGAGTDTLDGGPGNDTLAAGEGDDTLDSGPGDDALHGGGGSDRLNPGPGADLIDGGEGPHDELSYADAADPVSIDLTRPGGDGPAGENDTVMQGVDDFFLTDGDDRFVAGRQQVTVHAGYGSDTVDGSAEGDRIDGDGSGSNAPPDSDFGADRLRGHAGNDLIEGDAGSDTLDGGTGGDVLDGGRAVTFYQGTTTRYPSDDVIDGGPGGDRITYGWRVHAGPGDDNIDVRDFDALNHSRVIPLGRDGNVGCGAGNDFVQADYYDAIALDCEILAEGATPWQTLRPSRHGRVNLTARCAWRFAASCRGKVRLARTPAQTTDDPFRTLGITPAKPPVTPPGCRRSPSNVTLAAHSFRLRAGRVGRVELKLGRSGRRALARAGCLLVRASFRLRDPKGRPFEMTRTLALRQRA
jgi:Ca2+-binding RTX toxin-like protein